MMDVPRIWIVTDASVSALWVKVKGEDPHLARKARQLYRDIVEGKYHVALPFHWRLEVAGVIRSFVAARKLSLLEARRAMHWLAKFAQDYCVVCEPTLNWDETVTVADAWGFHLYDTLYLLLAQRVGGVFWTADLRLYRHWYSRKDLHDQVAVAWIGYYPQIGIPLMPP
ncbi:MAG: type II toxin-antitoxin system VapC family toxin [Armatimonadetes bacterium]|nr:type II toxin-antitoxin system VapC family toxin [Armatimonadota bacterium]MDW8027448.1 type II toxin-antitoxin system VapC family toxin [Armatimonadota bacterium]